MVTRLGRGRLVAWAKLISRPIRIHGSCKDTSYGRFWIPLGRFFRAKGPSYTSLGQRPRFTRTQVDRKG